MNIYGVTEQHDKGKQVNSHSIRSGVYDDEDDIQQFDFVCICPDFANQCMSEEGESCQRAELSIRRKSPSLGFYF